MEKSTNGIITAAAPAAFVALLLGVIAPGTALFGAQTATTDSVGPHGYVVVTVTRDGNEIYRHEDHNLITNAGKDFISEQIGSGSPGDPSPGTEGAHWIAVTTDFTAPNAADTTLTGEISSGGLARAEGDYAHTAGTNTFTITNTFSSTATHTNVQKAGLFTAAAAGTMMAENTFTPVTLNNGDQLTITWTITLS